MSLSKKTQAEIRSRIADEKFSCLLQANSKSLTDENILDRNKVIEKKSEPQNFLDVLNKQINFLENGKNEPRSKLRF